MSTAKIVVLFQSLLGIYGDRGNGVVLAKRLLWRDIAAELVFVEPGDEIPADGTVYLLGGGEDRAQITAVGLMRASAGWRRGLDAGAVLFAVCAGYQMCGHSFTVGHDDTVVPGLGLLDVETRRGAERAVGEILTRIPGVAGEDAWLTGFENHGGHTRLGSGATPLAEVVKGVGNCGDGTEGAVAPGGHVIGTYPHGPVLARNPHLADRVLSTALGRDLPPLELACVSELRQERRKTVGRL